jgi:hypothetical protein
LKPERWGSPFVLEKYQGACDKRHIIIIIIIIIIIGRTVTCSKRDHSGKGKLYVY